MSAPTTDRSFQDHLNDLEHLARSVRTASSGSAVHRLVESPPPHPGINHPLYAVEATAAVETAAYYAHHPGWWAAFSAAALLGSAGTVCWKNVDHPNRKQMTGYTAACVAGAGGLVTAAASGVAPWSAEGLGVLGILAAALGPVYSHLIRRNEKKEAEQVKQLIAKKEASQRDSWEEILHEAGVKDTWIDRGLTNDTWTDGKREFPAGFAMLLRLGRKAPNVKQLGGFIEDIERIAEHALGMSFFPGSIELLPIPGRSSRAELRVCHRDVLTETFYTELSDEPGDINAPFPVAVRNDGSTIDLDLWKNPHGMISAITGGGKTVTFNHHLVKITGCSNARVWLIAGRKAGRTMVNWLRPFFMGTINPKTGRPAEPCIDWAAGTWEEAVKVLLDAYKAIDVRESTASQTGDERYEVDDQHPRIVVAIDESPELLNDDRKIPYATHRGEKNLTIAELLLKLLTTGRSEAVTVLFVTQRSTNTMIGDHGGDVRSQLSYRVGLRSTQSDENSVFASDTTNVDLASLKEGQQYIEMSDSARPERAKGFYPTPEIIREAALTHGEWAGGIDDDTASELDFYHERWTSASQQEFFRTKICNNPVRTIPGGPVTRQPTDAESVAAVLDNPTPEITSMIEELGLTGEVMAAFQAWVDEHHPDEDVTPELLQEYVRDVWADATPQERSEYQQHHAKAEVDELERIWNLPSAERGDTEQDHDGYSNDEEEDYTGPDVEQFNPELPTATRKLLAALSESDCLHSGYTVVATEEIVRLAAAQLGWDPGMTVGGRKVADALREVNVHVDRLYVNDNDGNPVRDDTGKRMRVKGYKAADIHAAIEANRMADDEEE